MRSKTRGKGRPAVEFPTARVVSGRANLGATAACVQRGEGWCPAAPPRRIRIRAVPAEKTTRA
jgi:hypothetical protein